MFIINQSFRADYNVQLYSAQEKLDNFFVDFVR